VIDDGGGADTLTGSDGIDWFWVFPGDIMKKQGPGDIVTDQA
jgi:Ca2+-binding RTX toxin-like protein